MLTLGKSRALATAYAAALTVGALASGCAGDESITMEGEAAERAAAAVDCAPSAWTNPGKVQNPKVVAVPEGAGKTGKPFEQLAGLEQYDYTIQEHVISGSAPDYTSRIVVRKPRDPAKFSGTVFVEWYNVSGGIDFAVLWASSREYFMREGHAFVTVSAQAGGVNALRSADPERYGALKHPGDSAANTIFSQAGAAIRLQSETLLGPHMPVRAVLAAGQSQSSMRLAAYVNTTHKTDRVYDGYLLHSGLEPASNDPGVPVFVVMTMSEGNGRLADGPNMVKWVVAGASHNDERITSRGKEVGERIGQSASYECQNPLNRFPSHRVYNAALDGLHTWVRSGKRPPAGTPLELSGSRTALDEHGNSKGGVRIADIDVPVATYGLNNGPKNPFDIVGFLACGLGGTTVPFSEAKLRQLYPSHEDYVKQYTLAADAALARGYLLKADYDEAIAQARAAAIPN